MSYNLSEKKARINLVVAAKTIEKMLEESFSEYSLLISDATLEANLDGSRTDNPPRGNVENELSEKTKGSKWESSKQELVEAKLDASGKRQNTSGNIPKLEEKRLADKPVEKEKSEKAND